MELILKIFKNHQIYYIGNVLMLLLYACATPLSPTGGPKDMTPPKVVKSEPKNYSINFKSSVIKMSFNKYIKLNNINSNSIISPPMKDMPDFALKRKTLIITLKEKLKDTTTYTISLDNSIADIRENNIAKNLEYVFSTGEYLDALSINGEVNDAFTQKPEKDVIVMLYQKNIDSIPYKEKPLFISRTDKDGKFEIRNLKNSKFKIFALKDMNSNNIYDQPNEKIAYLDYTIIPEQRDTSKKDSLKVGKYKLQLFQEEDSVQKIIKSWVVNKKQIQIIFKYPVKKADYRLLSGKAEGKWNIKEYNKGRDTLNMWLTDFANDSIVFSVIDNKKTIDTIKLNLALKKSVKKSGKSGEKLQYRLNLSRIVPFDYYKPLVLQFSTPLKEFNFNNVKLLDGKDSLIAKIGLSDSAKRKVEIVYPFKEGHSYKLYVKAKSFKDIYDISNDTIKAEFKTQEQKYYGSLKVTANFDDNGIPRIISLLTEKDKIIKEVVMNKKGDIVFDYLYPGTYKLRMIYDSNKNGRWDTGKYLKNLQAEKIVYYPKSISTRANWEVEVEWDEGN